MKIIKAGLKKQIVALLQEVEDHCIFVTTDVSAPFCELIVEHLKPDVSVKVLTRFSDQEIESGQLDYDFSSIIETHFSNIWIGVLENLEANLYIFDNRTAVLTKANLTNDGFLNPDEYGTVYEDPVELANIGEAVEELLKEAVGYTHTSETIETIDQKVEATPEPEPEPVSLPENPIRTGRKSVSLEKISKLRCFVRGEEAELTREIRRISNEGENIHLQAYYMDNGIPEGIYVVVSSQGGTTEYSLDRIDTHISTLDNFSKRIEGLNSLDSGGK